ncbi:unnamed protein product [Rhizoctonia solani]|uniref:Uncharacterized protein n=1 Tax=Rhizoctonia solani TaxID=456999 RepID=A0A8H3D1R3_9AGAM|nr:unnamed protein product [Rhizoctonia solani]
MNAHNDLGTKRKLSTDASLPLQDHQKKARNKKIDGQRYVERLVRKALQNKKILPFRLLDLHTDIDNDKVEVTESGFRPTLNTETVLRAEDGPQMVVDLDGDVVMFYCPHYVTEKLSEHLLQCL